MRYLLPARNCILPRMSSVVHFTVDPHTVTGFSTLERLANINSVTRLNYSSLPERNSLNLTRFITSPCLSGTLTRTANLVTWLFHPLGIYYKRTPRGVPKDTEEHGVHKEKLLRVPLCFSAFSV